LLEGRARLTRGLSVANASVGNIRLGMFIPGFMLAIACIIYIVTLCTIHPESGPRIPRAPDEPRQADADRPAVPRR